MRGDVRDKESRGERDEKNRRKTGTVRGRLRSRKRGEGEEKEDRAGKEEGTGEEKVCRGDKRRKI